MRTTLAVNGHRTIPLRPPSRAQIVLDLLAIAWLAFGAALAILWGLA
jgi:hypothetical protein